MHPEAIHGSAQRSLELLTKTDIFNDFYLAGGTAAAIQLGHRVSVDLDLFSNEEFAPDKLRDRLNDQAFPLSNYNPEALTIRGQHEETKVSFIHYAYPLIENNVNFQGAKLASLLDIALMKLTAIAGRGSKKDFIDLAVMCDSIDVQKIVQGFKQKFPTGEMDLYHYMRSLTYFEDAEQDPDPMMLTPLTWEETKEKIRKIAKRISF